jgi:hypothetical protein
MTSNLGGPSDPPQEQAIPARASDADREAVVRTLHDAVARGLLTLEEGDERLAAAYAARFLHELPPLTADLPPAPAPAPTAPGWRAVLTAMVLELRSMLSGPSGSGTTLSKRRLAAAVVLAVAVLAIGAMTVGDLFEHGGRVEDFPGG